MSAIVHLGRWQDTIPDVECDAVISDPPYGARTHDGALQGGEMADGRRLNLTDRARGGDGCSRVEIDFRCWTPDDVHEFVRSWAPRTARWIVPMTSHDLLPAWEAAYRDAGWYAFAPIAVVIGGMGVRVLADGPANWTVHIPVARRRSRSLGSKAGSIWRSLPGGYAGPATPDMAGGRGKPRWLLDALVRDYSDEGHTIVDPFAGWGSTLVAARNAGRIAIGSEMDLAAHARCQAAIDGDMRAYARLGKRPAREPDPARPGLFDAIGGAR